MGRDPAGRDPAGKDPMGKDPMREKIACGKRLHVGKDCMRENCMRENCKALPKGARGGHREGDQEQSLPDYLTTEPYMHCW